MRKKDVCIILFVMLLMSTLFVAFQPTKAQNQIIIGIIGPQGLDHWSPAGMKDAAELVRDEINAAGGVHLSDGDYDIVLAFGNDHTLPPPGGDPDAAALEAERLIVEEGCEFIIGGFRTETTAAILEVCALYGVPYFINGASTTELISETVCDDYEKYKYTFRYNPINSSALVATLAAFLQYYVPTKLLPLYGHMIWPEAPNPQVRVAVLTEDLEWTLVIHTLLTNPELLGYPPTGILGPYMNVTYGGRIPDGTTDCSPWLQAVKDSDARVLIHIFSGATGIPLIAQWNAMNVSAIPVGINVMSQTQGMWTYTGGGCKYETFLNFVGTRTPITPQAVEFWDNFVDKTGVWPIYTAFGAYDGIKGLAEALEATGTKNKDALVTYFESPAYNRSQLNGIFKFDSCHDVYTDSTYYFWPEPHYVRSFLVQWQDPEQVEVVGPIDQNYTGRWAIPPWMYPLITDINYDGKVRVDDVLLAATAFGTSPGDLRYEMESDINYDRKIRVDDILAIAITFGDTISLPLP